MPTLVFAFSLAGLLSLEFHALKSTPYPAGYLHPWNSDVMMQSIRIIDLKREPLRSLVCLEKQPPALNTIRAGLAMLTGNVSEGELLRSVDRGMRFIWAIFYALLNALIFSWIRMATSSPLVALIGTILWAINPAPVHFSVLLEGTLMSALATTWLLYELHRSLQRPEKSMALALSAVVLFHVRSVFQWYFFPFLLLAAKIGGISLNALKRLAATCLVLSLPLLIKLYIFTGTIATTTFEGDHKLGLTWHVPTQEEFSADTRALPTPITPAPGTFARWVFDYCPSSPQAFTNQVNLRLFNQWAIHHPTEVLSGVARSIQVNGEAFWSASALSNSDHVTSFLPLRAVYLYVFSQWRYLALVGVTIFLWILRIAMGDAKLRPGKLRATAAFSIVIGYILAIIHISNRYEWTEADRLKFFLEPVFFVFLISQLWIFIRAAFSAHRTFGIGQK